MKKVFALSLSIVLSWALAACGGNAPTSGSASSSTAAPASSAPAADASTSPAATAGKGSKEPIKIGITGAASGTDGFLGQVQLNGVKLAIEDLNAKGGIVGREVKLIEADDANDPSKAGNIAQQFAQRDKVDAIIGATNDGTTLVFGQVAEQVGIPMIVPFANGDNIAQGKKWVFQVDVASSVFVDELSRYALEKSKKIAIFYDDNAFGQYDRDLAIEDLKAAKVQPVASVAAPNGAKDYTAQMTQMKNAGAEVIIAPMGGTNVAQALKNMKQMNWKPTLIGPNSLAFESMIEVGKENVEGVLFLDVIDESKPEVMEFQKKYKAKYNQSAVTGFEVLAYDSMMILADALQKGGGDKNKVRDVLENLKGYKAISGKKDSTISYSVTDHRRADQTNLVWRTVKDGKFVNK